MGDSSICPECGREFSGRRHMKQHYTCADDHEGSLTGFETKCAKCGDTMRVAERRQVHSDSYCSDDCENSAWSDKFSGKDNPNSKEKVKKSCKNGCGEIVSRCPSQVPESGNLFCSKGCETEWRAEHWQSESERRYYGADWRSQSEKARKRAGHTCEKPDCESTESRRGLAMEVHHIIPFKCFEDSVEANQLSNLVVLCTEHHAEAEPVNYGEVSTRIGGRREGTS